MVEKGCAACKEWQEHYYWEHMDVTKIRFFKLMTGDFTKGIISVDARLVDIDQSLSEKLTKWVTNFHQSIPEKFVKNFNGKITKEYDLKGPSGETWQHQCGQECRRAVPQIRMGGFCQGT
ncbi:hypothetical protein EJB05_00678, partial [Eragrostis curvula]